MIFLQLQNPLDSQLICRCVKPGSIIHTDCWRAYNGIVHWDHDYVHGTVNHSVGFVNGDVCTNTIEGINVMDYHLNGFLIDANMEWDQAAHRFRDFDPPFYFFF